MKSTFSKGVAFLSKKSTLKKHDPINQNIKIYCKYV